MCARALLKQWALVKVFHCTLSIWRVANVL